MELLTACACLTVARVSITTKTVSYSIFELTVSFLMTWIRSAFQSSGLAVTDFITIIWYILVSNLQRTNTATLETYSTLNIITSYCNIPMLKENTGNVWWWNQLSRDTLNSLAHRSLHITDYCFGIFKNTENINLRTKRIWKKDRVKHSGH